MAENKINGVAVNNEAIVKIAGIAAMEIEGVASLAKRPVELEIKSFKNLFKSPKTQHSKAIALTVDSGALILDVYINVLDNLQVKTVAENVQANVKDKVQSMTGNAVARVNVHVADVTPAIEE